MTTLNDLRQQLEDDYLEPAIEETPQVPITGNLGTSDTQFNVEAGILSPDEESYFAPGRVIELNNEAMRIKTYDESTKLFTVLRAQRGTSAQTHATGDLVRIPTRWLRSSQLRALRNAVNSLWQPLYASHEELVTVDTSMYVALPTSTVRILSVEYETRHARWRPAEWRFFATHPLDDDQAAVQVSRGPYANALCLVRYGTQILPPTNDDDEIANLPSKWERIVLADAAANLLSGVDVDAYTQEVMTEKIRLENFPVRSGGSIAQSLIRYREYLVNQAHAELKAQSPRKKVHLEATAWRA